MEVVEDSEDAVALGELEVVKVVCLGRWESGEVIPGVGVQGVEEGEAEPNPS